MSVLRRFFAMRAAHAGWPGPGFPSALRPVTWWTATVVPVSHSSHSRLVRRGSGFGFVSESCEVDGAGGVECFLRAADGQPGEQDSVFVTVAGG